MRCVHSVIAICSLQQWCIENLMYRLLHTTTRNYYYSLPTTNTTGYRYGTLTDCSNQSNQWCGSGGNILPLRKMKPPPHQKKIRAFLWDETSLKKVRPDFINQSSTQPQTTPQTLINFLFFYHHSLTAKLSEQRKFRQNEILTCLQSHMFGILNAK